jgi:hypothetical protein
MMPRHLRKINMLLGIVCAGLAAYIVWELVRPSSNAAPSRARTGPVAPATAPAPAPAEPAGGYGIIVSRNLFSPARSDAPVVAGTGLGGVVAPPSRPTLFGIVLREGAPIAYLEDPVTKRVSGYRIGDAVGGGTVSTIAADKIVLARPEGTLDVRLHDPTKPRPTVSAPPGPNQTGVPPTAVAPPAVPGIIPPAAMTPPPVASGAPQPGPGVQAPQAPQQFFPPGRRALPPNLQRRLPGMPSNAPSQ